MSCWRRPKGRTWLAEFCEPEAELLLLLGARVAVDVFVLRGAPLLPTVTVTVELGGQQMALQSQLQVGTGVGTGVG